MTENALDILVKQTAGRKFWMQKLDQTKSPTGNVTKCYYGNRKYKTIITRYFYIGNVYLCSKRERCSSRKLQRGDEFCVLPSCNVPPGRLSIEMRRQQQQQHLLQSFLPWSWSAQVLPTMHPSRLLWTGFYPIIWFSSWSAQFLSSDSVCLFGFFKLTQIKHRCSKHNFFLVQVKL